MKDFYGRDMTVQTLPINLMLIIDHASERGREVRFGAERGLLTSRIKEACVRELVRPLCSKQLSASSCS